jgi:hypothetical protein
VQYNDKGIEYGLDKNFDIAVWEQEKKYIASSKTKFFGFVFNRINQGLKKRNLEPIFTVKKPLANKQKSQSVFGKGTRSTKNKNNSNDLDNLEEYKQNFANTNIGFNINMNNIGKKDNAESSNEINFNDILSNEAKEESKI